MRNSSNYNKANSKELEIASNLSELWITVLRNNCNTCYFPEGLMNNKQNERIRTPKVNAMFQAIPSLAGVSNKNKIGVQFETAKNLTG